VNKREAENQASSDLNDTQKSITMNASEITLNDDLKVNEGVSSEPIDSRAQDRQTLMKGLNNDLAGEYQAMLMYIHYSARITGPYRRELRGLFQAEIGDEQAHAQFLADKIAALGGIPTTRPLAVPQADQPREMLEQALAGERGAIAGYSERIRQAEEFGDIGLKVILESHVADETRHKEEIERILDGWVEPDVEESVRAMNRWQNDGGQG
jgi:bacterioferritin